MQDLKRVEGDICVKAVVVCVCFSIADCIQMRNFNYLFVAVLCSTVLMDDGDEQRQNFAKTAREKFAIVPPHPEGTKKPFYGRRRKFTLAEGH